MENQLRKGMIVVVVTGKAYGNRPGTITKIVSREGEVSDLVHEYTGKGFHSSLKGTILCEAKESPWSKLLYCNKKVVCEDLSDLKPATAFEKNLYRKGCYCISGYWEKIH